MNQNHQQGSRQRSYFFPHLFADFKKNHFRTIQFLILANIKLMTHTPLTFLQVTKADFFFLDMSFQIHQNQRFQSLIQIPPIFATSF